MHGWSTRALLILLCTVLAPALAAAQASITGVIRDPSGAVLPGVTVEAASPALIERVRSVVSDGNGQYRIVDLRPGTYTVTFTLPGFNVSKRDGLELTGQFSATLNATLSVGAVQETITVTGETPVVDVQSTTNQRVMTAEVIGAIPAGRSHLNYGVLIPGLSSNQGASRGQTMDVGGTNNLQNTLVSMHGGRRSDTRLMIDGVRIGNLAGEGQWTNYTPDTGGAQEVTIDYGSMQAEQLTGGLRINLVPREGGNNFAGSFFATFVNEDWQGSNLTPELTARGLGEPNRMKQAYDFNPSVGGPIVRDKLWFFVSARFQDNQSYVAGTYANKNAADPTKWTYDPDPSQQSVFSISQNSGSARFTWQAAPRHKVTFYQDFQSRDWDDGVPNISPEAIVRWRFPRLSLTQAAWTSPMTSRLLLEARSQFKTESFYDLYPPLDPVYKGMITVRDQATGICYRSPTCHSSGVFGSTFQNIFSAQASMSYVTGTHAMKVGFTDTWADLRGASQSNDYAMEYRFNNGVPNQLTMRGTPTESASNLKAELGIFAQDRWTVNRATINLGLRYDYHAGYWPELYLGPGLFVPTRDITFPHKDAQSWHDISPRAGVAYDLFGNGRTAIKVNAGRYALASAATTGVSPSGAVSNSVTRAWTDADRDFTPDCVLLNLQANGECGVVSNLLFGQQLAPTTAWDPALLQGWHVRPYNWEFSTSVQQQIAPRVGIEFGYFRRIFGNFRVTDNLATGPADYDEFSVTAPSDPRLPNGGGYVISNLYDLNPSKVGQVNNYVTKASNFGKQTEHWNGFDLTISARPRNGVLLQGGMSTGRASYDGCEIRDAMRGEFNWTPDDTAQGIAYMSQFNPYCNVVENWLTQVKFLGTYLIPKIDVQFAGTFQSMPGWAIASIYNVPSAQAALSLGRPLSGGAANAPVNLLQPGSTYNDRANQLDFRMSKIFRFGARRATVNFDIYNALNANPVLLQNNNYAVWLQPQKIMDPRLFKLSAQLDF